MDLDLRDAGFYQNPYAAYAGLRARGPVFRSAHGPWVVLGFPEVSRLLKEPRLTLGFPAEQGWHARRGGAAADGARWMLLRDGDAHHALRRAARRGLSPRAIAESRAQLLKAIDATLEALPGASTVQFVEDFAEPVVAAVVRQLVGLPAGHDAQLARWSSALIRMADPLASIDVRAELDSAMLECRAFVEDCRRSGELEPGGVAAELLADDDAFGREDAIANVVLVLTAGIDTVVGQLTSAMFALLCHPEQMSVVREKPGAIRVGGPELVRYRSPVQIVSRQVAADLDTAAGTMRAGDKVMLVLGAANRDPQRYPDPDRLWLMRPKVASLAFGGGAHFCLGARLAPLIVSDALAGFVARYRHIVATDRPLHWRASVVAHQLDSLPLTVATA